METLHESLFEEEETSKSSVALAEVNFDFVDTGRWLLKVVGGPNHGAEFSMGNKREYVIGTDSSLCDIVFQDTSVSRQHAKITIETEETLFIEDLDSRNGIFVDNHKIAGKEELPLQTILTLGTTLFAVYDREKEMQTIVSPYVTQTPTDSTSPEIAVEEAPSSSSEEMLPSPSDVSSHGSYSPILVVLAAALLCSGILIGMMNLFSSPQKVAAIDLLSPQAALKEALKKFPCVHYTFNEATGHLLVIGHVLTGIEREQVLYNLESLPFIKNLDDKGIIIDEYVWRETNHILSQNPSAKGITLHTPEAGRFVLTGTFTTRKDAQNVLSYLDNQFPYLDLLERKMIVEEDLIRKLDSELRKEGIEDVTIQIVNGEVVFTGTLPSNKVVFFDTIVSYAKKMQGVRAVYSYVAEERPHPTITNVTHEYQIDGILNVEGLSPTPVIDGKFLAVGSALDGRRVTQIAQNQLFMEDEEGKIYQIDY